MANLTIPERPTLTTLADDDLFGVVDMSDAEKVKGIRSDNLANALAAKLGASARNILINGNPGDVMQRQDPATLTSVADDAYGGADRYYVLTQTASIQSQRTSGSHQKNAWRLKQNQSSAQRFGFAQIAEHLNCFHLRSKYVTFAGRINISNSQAVRFAILEWTGTADTVTSDVVNDWTSATYTAGNFFLGSNLTVAGVGTITPSAATWTDFSLSAQLGVSTNNIIAMVWTEGTAAQDVTIDIEELQMIPGQIVLPYNTLEVGATLRLCQRYFEKSYDLDTPPGTATATGELQINIVVTGTLNYKYSAEFKVAKRVVPTVVAYDEAGASGKVYKGGNGKTALIQNSGTNRAIIGTTDATSTNVLAFHFTADAEL